MTTATVHRRRRAPLFVAIALAVAAFLSACSQFTDESTPLPSAPSSAAPTSSAPTTPPADCDDALESYAPADALPRPGNMPAGSTMRRIQDRGRVIAGVSADTYLLGSRNPLTGQIEGFDIDLVKAVAQAILGRENAYELKVITAADRITALQDNTVDLVARNMTINCDRWTQIAFSSEYYRSGQKILVRRGSKATTLADLDGEKVCAPAGTSSMANLVSLAPEVIPVSSSSHTGCLALFQQGEVAAITGDDTVLAGLAAQDPYAVVPEQVAFTDEPYGVGINAENVDLARFVNGVLEQRRADGDWTESYNTWLRDALGPAPTPPRAVYGREP